MVTDRRYAYYMKHPHMHDSDNFLARYDRGMQLKAQWKKAWKVKS